ncbi:hypothetical protein [Streptomyces sp. NPDC051677]
MRRRQPAEVSHQLKFVVAKWLERKQQGVLSAQEATNSAVMHLATA